MSAASDQLDLILIVVYVLNRRWLEGRLLHTSSLAVDSSSKRVHLVLVVHQDSVRVTSGNFAKVRAQVLNLALRVYDSEAFLADDASNEDSASLEQEEVELETNLNLFALIWQEVQLPKLLYFFS